MCSAIPIGQAEGVSVEEVADALYALPPEAFTAARTAAAKADRTNAKQISALRKPTVGAWLVNTLARSAPDLLDELLALGPALFEAQRSGNGAQLRDLGGQRRQLVGAVTDNAFAAADRAPTAAARAEVESTLEAALADPVTADAVRSGRLVRPLSYAGFGDVDLDGAVAVGHARPSNPKPSTPAGKTRLAPSATESAKPDRTQDIAAAEASAQDAAGELDDAVRACQRAQQEQDATEEAEQQAAADVTAAEEVLRAARDARTAAEQAARKTRHRSEQAAKEVTSAQARAEKARTTLDKLRRG